MASEKAKESWLLTRLLAASFHTGFFPAVFCAGAILIVPFLLRANFCIYLLSPRGPEPHSCRSVVKTSPFRRAYRQPACSGSRPIADCHRSPGHSSAFVSELSDLINFTSVLPNCFQGCLADPVSVRRSWPSRVIWLVRDAERIDST